MAKVNLDEAIKNTAETCDATDGWSSLSQPSKAKALLGFTESRVTNAIGITKLNEIAGVPLPEEAAEEFERIAAILLFAAQIVRNENNIEEVYVDKDALREALGEQ